MSLSEPIVMPSSSRSSFGIDARARLFATLLALMLQGSTRRTSGPALLSAATTSSSGATLNTSALPQESASWTGTGVYLLGAVVPNMQLSRCIGHAVSPVFQLLMRVQIACFYSSHIIPSVIAGEATDRGGQR